MFSNKRDMIWRGTNNCKFNFQKKFWRSWRPIF